MNERTKLYWHCWIQYLAKEGILNNFLDALIATCDNSAAATFRMRTHTANNHGYTLPVLEDIQNNAYANRIDYASRRNSIEDRVRCDLYNRVNAGNNDTPIDMRRWSEISFTFRHTFVNGNSYAKRINIKTLRNIIDRS